MIQLPTVPQDVSATGGDALAAVSWTPSTSGGPPVLGYTVTSTPDGQQAVVAGEQRKATVTGLHNGVAYTFTVSATNAVGSSGESAPSNATVVQPQPAGGGTGGTADPAAPAFPLLIAGNGVLEQSWHRGPAAPHDVTITGFVVRTYTAAGTLVETATTGATCTRHVVRGLPNGTAHYFTVASLTAAGESRALRSPLAVPAPRYEFHDDEPRQHRYDMSEEASVAANFSTAASPDYAGTAIDWNARCVRTMYVDGPDFAARRAALTADGATPSPELLAVWPVKYSRAWLRAVQTKVEAGLSGGAAAGVRISRVSERLTINKIVVHAVPATAETLDRLHETHGLVGDELALAGDSL